MDTAHQKRLPEEAAKPSADGDIIPARRLWWNRSVPSSKLAVFIRQLATMVHSGLPLLKALEILLRQEKSKYFHRVIRSLADNIRGGNTLSDGLSRIPEIFDQLTVNMVRAGEASGALDLILLRLARYREKNLQTRNKIAAALYYPCIVLITAGITVNFG